MDFLEILSIDVCINLCRRDIGVAQHFLDSPQVCTAFQQVSGKRMAEGVWMHVFLDSGTLRVATNDIPDRHS